MFEHAGLPYPIVAHGPNAWKWKPTSTRERADKHAKRQLELFSARVGQERYAAARGIAPPA